MQTRAFPRILGWLTLGYGAYTAARPQSLVHAAGLEPPRSRVSRPGRALARVIGARDLLSGLAMVLAPSGAPLRAAVAVRVLSDTVDVVGFGTSVPPRYRTRVIGVAAGWGALCAASLLTTGPDR
jgi:hypothetical protein